MSVKTKLSSLAVLFLLVTTITVVATTTFFEIGIPEQNAYAKLCPAGYHWDDDQDKCISGTK